MLKPFFIRVERALIKIHPEKVVGLQTVGNYTKIYVDNDTFYMTRASLATALKKMPADMFIKINRSYAISINHIIEIHRDMVRVGDIYLPITKQHYKMALEKLIILE